MYYYFVLRFVFVFWFTIISISSFAKDIYVSAIGKYGVKNTLIIRKNTLNFCVQEGEMSDNSQWDYKIVGDTIYVSDNGIYFKARLCLRNDNQLFDLKQNINYYNKQYVKKLLGGKSGKVYVYEGKLYTKKTFRQLNILLRNRRKNIEKVEFLKPLDAEKLYGIYGINGAVIITLNN